MDGGQNLAGRRSAQRRTIQPRLAIGLTLLSVFLWGFSPIGTRYLVGNNQASLPALAFAGIRYGLAALCFAPFLWRTRSWRAADWRLAVLSGCLGIAGYNIPATIGQRTVSAGLTGLLDGAEPLMIILISAIVIRRVPSRMTLIASAIALTGVLILARASGPTLGDPLGIALVLLGATLWAGYCVAVPPLINRHGPIPATAAVMLCGAIPLALLGAPQTPAMLHAITPAQSIVLLMLVIGSSVFATLCWNAGSAVLGAARAGWFLYLVPLVSLIGGVLLLGEPVKPGELAGGFLVLVSVYLSQYPSQTASPPNPRAESPSAPASAPHSIPPPPPMTSSDPTSPAPAATPSASGTP